MLYVIGCFLYVQYKIWAYIFIYNCLIGAFLSWENYHRLGKAITLNFGNFQIDLTYYLKEYITNSLNRTRHTVLKLRTRIELTGR